MNMLQMRQKRASSSKKSSRRRQELMQAKEFEMKQHVQQEKVRISKTVASIVAVIFGTQRWSLTILRSNKLLTDEW